MKHLKKITAIITVLIGIVVIFLGTSVMDPSANHKVSAKTPSYTAGYYNAEYASFGADFYTYIYEASDIIVDELNDINSAMGVLVQAQNAATEAAAEHVEATDDLISTVGKVGGMVIVAIGLAIVANGLQAVGAAFVPAPIRQPEFVQASEE